MSSLIIRSTSPSRRLHHYRILTSATLPLYAITAPRPRRSLMNASLSSISNSHAAITTRRAHDIIRQFSSSPHLTMASSNPKSNNNEEFRLEALFDVKGKVALVTGGGSGIGLMATQALAVNGAKVYIVGRTEEKLDRVAETYGQNITGKIVPVQADITSKQDIKSLYDQIAQMEPHLDILINNAGISTVTVSTEAKTAEEMRKNMFDNEESTFEDWDDVYRTNVSQCYFMSTAFLPLLSKASETTPKWSSTIINISSISGQVKTAQHHPQYNASKAATIHLTRMLANHVAENGIKIRINSIAPGVFPSEMTASDSDANQKSHIPKDKYADKVPAARPGNDRDMGAAVLFVASNQYLNGQTVTVDGGYTLAAGL